MVFPSSKIKKLIFLLFCFFFFSFGMFGCTSGGEDVSVLEDGLDNIDTEIDSDLLDNEDDEDEEFADSEDGDVEDDEDVELAQLDDEFGDSDDEDDEFADLDEDDEDGEDDEFADLDEDDEDGEDDEFADLDEDDGDGDDDEFADLDEDDEDGEDDEFADLDEDDEDGEDDEFADLDEDDEDGEDDEFADLDEDDGDGDDDEFGDSDDEDDGDGGELAQNEESLGEELEQSKAPDQSGEFPEQVVGQEGEKGEEPPSESQDTVVSQAEETSLPQDDLGEADPISDEKGDETPSWVPVVKIKTDTEYRNSRLINAVYIVRPQDTMESISKKIYGDKSKMEELNANNLHLSRGIDPGDKVYYNSPNRPDDKTQLKFFYEDIGLEPQIYITKENDNMRRLGSRLLGFADGWKEIWATNQNVDSKTILPGGLQLKYWTGNEPPVNVVEVTPKEEEGPPVKEDVDDGSEVLTEEPQQDMGTIGKIAESPPKEPDIPVDAPLPEPQMNMPENDLEPVSDAEAFSEPEPELEAEPETSQAITSNTESESLVSVGALALILLAGLVLVVIQIKKRSSATTLNPSSLEYTQV